MLTYSLESMKCVNELLMKQRIPYNYRETYCLIITTIATIINVGIAANSYCMKYNTLYR